MKNKIPFRYPLIWALLILLLSVIPVPETPTIDWMEPDKLVHVIFYIILTFLLCRAVSDSGIITGLFNLVVISLIISVLYGAFIEYTQEYLLAWRSGDRFDFAADVLGAVLGSLIFNYFYTKSKKKKDGFKEKSQC